MYIVQISWWPDKTGGRKSFCVRNSLRQLVFAPSEKSIKQVKKVEFLHFQWWLSELWGSLLFLSQTAYVVNLQQWRVIFLPYKQMDPVIFKAGIKYHFILQHKHLKGKAAECRSYFVPNPSKCLAQSSWRTCASCWWGMHWGGCCMVRKQEKVSEGVHSARVQLQERLSGIAGCRGMEVWEFQRAVWGFPVAVGVPSGCVGVPGWWTVLVTAACIFPALAECIPCLEPATAEPLSLTSIPIPFPFPFPAHTGEAAGV